VYAISHAWIDRLSDERDPHAYDLCRRHSDRVRPPHGWELIDRRYLMVTSVA
jgi:hypothetical protein